MRRIVKLQEGHDMVLIARSLIKEKDFNRKMSYWNTLVDMGSDSDEFLDILIFETDPDMLKIAWDYLSPHLDVSTLRLLSSPARVINDIIPSKASELLRRTNESKKIKIKESQLRSLISETIKKVLKEDKFE